jgi:Phytanoyl-CoA dioxygenase (PhyH)
MQAVEVEAIRVEPVPLTALTESQIATFRRDGFLVIDAPQISEIEIDRCRKLLMSLMQRKVGRIEGRLFDISARQGGDDGITPQLFRPSLYAKELSQWPFRPVGLAIAKQLLGPEATLSADNAVFKPARIGGTTPWHQDEAYNDPRFYQEQITIWMALYDTTPANGAMAFVPESHRLGILPHRLNGGSKEANSIECCGDFPRETAIVCPIQAGGLTIHQGRTIHGASRNISDGPRLGYVLNYKNPPRSRPELGSFPWNDDVARRIHRRRKVWLACGGVLVETLRYVRSDRDNLRHLLQQIAKRFSRSSSRRA